MPGNRAGEVGHTAAASVSPCRNLGTSLVCQVALMPQQSKLVSAQSGLTGLGLGARGLWRGGPALSHPLQPHAWFYWGAVSSTLCINGYLLV